MGIGFTRRANPLVRLLSRRAGRGRLAPSPRLVAALFFLMRGMPPACPGWGEAWSPAASPPPPPALHGLYLPAGRLLRGIWPEEWEAWAAAGIDALVVDVKNDEGWVLGPLAVPQVDAFGARWAPQMDLGDLALQARRRGFRLVARIVALKDDRVPRIRPDLALRDREGGVWRDRRGRSWLDPASGEVRRYIADLARHAAELGFAEVQLDYVRFPSEGPLDRLRWERGDRSAAIQQLVSSVARALEGTGVTLSLAIFGQVCVFPGDMGIGQRCEALADVADLVAPMAYPSHYRPGSFGLASPERLPGATVALTLAVASTRVEPKRMRPWLQAFSLRVPYGPQELAAQIQAAERAGTAGWLLWNPRGEYPYLGSALALVRRARAATFEPEGLSAHRAAVATGHACWYPGPPAPGPRSSGSAGTVS